MPRHRDLSNATIVFFSSFQQPTPGGSRSFKRTRIPALRMTLPEVPENAVQRPFVYSKWLYASSSASSSISSSATSSSRGKYSLIDWSICSQSSIVNRSSNSSMTCSGEIKRNKVCQKTTTKTVEVLLYSSHYCFLHDHCSQDQDSNGFEDHTSKSSTADLGRRFKIWRSSTFISPYPAKASLNAEI